MPSAKDKKLKTKLLKVDMSSGSDNDSEHELSYYAKDKVKLMKEVLKLIKPKKIKAMAPDCIKNLNVVEINSMLLEELLGISNKRLQYIFNGENVDRETSSSESEEEKQPIDIISLDDISDDDDIELCISQNEKEALEAGSSKKNKKHKSHKIKTERPDAVVKTEKPKKDNKNKLKKSSEGTNKDENLKEAEKEKLMSVLELLELQARARAIRSQLAIETEKKNESAQNTKVKQESDTDSDAIIVDSPHHKEIVITSDSENETSDKQVPQAEHENERHNSTQTVEDKLTECCIPPPKKQKTSNEENSTQSHTANEENQNKDNSSNVSKTIDTIDLTDKSKETSASDLKSRKEKLLSKIQKIKLIRNKPAINTEPEKTQTDISNCVNEVVAAVSVTNVENLSNSTLDNSENTKENLVKELVVEISNSTEEEHNDSSEQSENKSGLLKISKNVTSEKRKVSYCDNDEIVINLDEDEMDDMEND